MRKRADGQVFGEGSVRRLSSGVPSVLCAGVVTVDGQTQETPLDGTLRAITHAADGLTVQFWVGESARTLSNPNGTSTLFRDTAVVEGDLAEVNAGNMDGFKANSPASATLFDGEVQVDTTNLMRVADPNEE